MSRAKCNGRRAECSITICKIANLSGRHHIVCVSALSVDFELTHTQESFAQNRTALSFVDELRPKRFSTNPPKWHRACVSTSTGRQPVCRRLRAQTPSIQRAHGIELMSASEKRSAAMDLQRASGPQGTALPACAAATLPCITIRAVRFKTELLLVLCPRRRAAPGTWSICGSLELLHLCCSWHGAQGGTGQQVVALCSHSRRHGQPWP